MQVLVFDDSPAIGRLVARIATFLGIEATAVTDAETFSRHLQVDRPQIVVLDLELGATDGIEQLRLLADRKCTAPIVLMSGYDARVLATAAELGVSLGLKIDSTLEKPLRVADVERILERLQSARQPPSVERVREAITNDELSLEFQPIVSRRSNTLRKLETLVRWNHPTHGRILPAEFLPVAELDRTTIDALTKWVILSTIDAYKVLGRLGVNVPLALNVSPQNLHDLTLPDRIETYLRSGGMPAEHLCLEITESIAFKDAARTMDILSRLRLRGIQLSIDDFGTGYSSLKMLRQMPFSEIKIDQSFVVDATTSRDSWAIVKSIIDLAGNMNMDSVAEGVETAETADLLDQMEVGSMQGYFIARPMAVQMVPVWLSTWR
jgi:EAL domain-containing protein (putative c-di-GMP-specific phosphodiesterase class I)